jgi:hypothetical protein
VRVGAAAGDTKVEAEKAQELGDSEGDYRGIGFPMIAFPV